MHSIWRSILRPRGLPSPPNMRGIAGFHSLWDAILLRASWRLAEPFLQDKLLDRLPRSDSEPWHMRHNIGVRSEKKQVKLDWATKKMDLAEVGEGPQDAFINHHDNNLTGADVIYSKSILDGSTHRDGAIYKTDWIQCYAMDMADRNETRDDMDGLLNYVFNRSRDDPIIVQQGSLMAMTGPKRGIALLSDVVFEFDMRIKTGENEADDIQLIDGLIHYEDHIVYDTPFTIRLSGNYGAVDMSLAAVERGVEAVIEVAISEVQSDCHLSLSCGVYLFFFERSCGVYLEDVLKEVELFYCAAREMGIKRSVVAVPMDSTMHLKFKIGQKGSDGDAMHCCSFDARLHGCARRQIKLGMACVSMKVTWRPPVH